MFLEGALGAMLGLTGWKHRGRGALYAHAVTARRERHMKPHGGRYWYLLLAGAAEGSRGLPAVLAPALAEADAERLFCYTEVTNWAQLPAFLAAGFEVIEEMTLFDVKIALLARRPAA